MCIRNSRYRAALAAIVAAGAALYLDQRPETPPSAQDEATAARLRAYYAEHPPRADWRVRQVIAELGRVLVRLEIPSAQAAALLKSPMGYQQARIAGACPAQAVQETIDAATEIQIRARMPSGETFLRVDCGRFAAESE
jgi:hypothetical protein